jgi:glutathione S-transferase
VSEFERPGAESSELDRYRLYGSPDSANLVVRMVLEELGEDYDYVPVDRLTSQQKSASYRQLNPQGLIPVLEAPGQEVPLFETAAIILFLGDRHRALAPSQDAPDRGRFLRWLFFISNTLHSDLRIFFKPKRYLPCEEQQGLFGETMISRISTGFGYLDHELEVTGRPFLLGEQMTCLDLYLAACARWAQIYGSRGSWDLSETPYLSQMLGVLEDRPAVRKACEMEQIVGSPFLKPAPVALPGVTS